MSWIITEDHLEGEEVDIQSRDFVALKQCPHKFRIRDGDGILCYSGVSSDYETEGAFRPLDEYGTPNSGATEIQYLEDGSWVTL